MNNLTKVQKKMKKRIKKDIINYTKEIRRNPKDFKARYNRGTSYVENGEHSQAINDYKMAIKINRNFPEAHCNLGSCYAEQLRYDKAIESFTMAIEQNPKFHDAFHNRGNTNYCQGNKVAAIADYTMAITLILEKFRNQISDDGTKGNGNGTNPDFKMNDEINQRYRDALYNRGIAYSDIENYDSAIDDFTEIIRKDRTDIFAIAARGIAQSKKGEHKLAIDDFTMIIEVDPKNVPAEIFYMRGVEYEIIGDHNLSISDYTKAALLGYIDAQHSLMDKGLNWK